MTAYALESMLFQGKGHNRDIHQGTKKSLMEAE